MGPGEVGFAAEGAWFLEWLGTASQTGVSQRFDAMERFANGEVRYFYNTLALRPAGQAAVLELQRSITGVR